MGVGSSHESCSSNSMTNLRNIRESCKDFPSRLQQTEDVTGHNRDKKKQRLPNFNSFKKRIVRHKKSANAADHSKQFFEHFSNKPVSVLASLLEHFEVLLVLRDLKIQADLARPPAHTLKQNLETLYVRSYCPDFKLIYLDTIFNVHKSVLWTRCPYFKDMLLAAGSPSHDLLVRLQTPGVDVSMFSSLLRFLYTGEYPSQEMSPRQIDILISLARECGVPNLLEVDLEHLYLSAEYTDCILVFTQEKTKKNESVLAPQVSSGSSSSSKSVAGAGEVGQHESPHHVEISCHKALLCARSPFFRNLILRRLQSSDNDAKDKSSQSAPEPMRLVLDETVIPLKYAKVLAHALYVDTIDFDLVDDKHAEVVDRVKDAMELYQIGRFLDLDIMAQNCEDAIVQRLNETNVVEVLEWSGQPHGSAWVHRQTMQYLLEDFVHVTSSAALENINKDTLKTVISSDFVQASESDILKAVIKWGELVVARRGEAAAVGSSSSKPILMSASTGGRQRPRQRNVGICDRDVAEVVHDLMSCVRLENMLGESEVVKHAIERGLLTRPKYKSNPAFGRSCEYMLGGCDSGADIFGPLGHLHYRPRLFVPHYEQCKLLYSEKTSDSSTTEVNSFNFHSMNAEMPDALYMVNKARLCFSRPQPMMPDNDNIQQMVARIQKLYQSKAVQRALASSLADHHQFMLQLELRVVREFNLPDTFVSVLQNALEGGSVMYDYEGDEKEDCDLMSCSNMISSQCCTPCTTSQQQESAIPDIAMASSVNSLCMSKSSVSPWLPAPPPAARCIYNKSFKPSPDVVVGAVSASLATSGGMSSMSSSYTGYSHQQTASISRHTHRYTGSRPKHGTVEPIRRHASSAQLDDIPTVSVGAGAGAPVSHHSSPGGAAGASRSGATAIHHPTHRHSHRFC